jgi:tetratricopeptide (TPR) repeat protein
MAFLCQYSWAQPDSLLVVLRRTMNEREEYVKVKIKRIEGLRHELDKVPAEAINHQYNLVNRLYHEYKAFIYDSAFNYAKRLSQLALKMNDQSKKEYARVKTAFILISSGMFKETFDSLRMVNSHLLSDSSKLDYYLLMARANFDLGDFDNDHFYRKIYLKNANAYLDSGIALCKPNSFGYLDISNYKNIMNDKIAKALDDLNLLLEMDQTEHQRAVNYHHLGLAYLKQDETSKAMEAFTKSSIADLRTATKETAAMASLAELLYKDGDIENAYVCIKQAMEDAIFYGARQRKVQIGSLLPVIAAERLNKSESQRQVWLIYSIALTIIAITISILVIVTIRQYRKLKTAEQKIMEANLHLQEINNKLREADRIKEEYIGYYFNINSDYLDKIEAFKNAVNQKLLSKKFEDLRFVADALDLKREREDLYKGFDKVFVKLFPDFVATFNTLFPPEHHMILKEGQILNTELRIFALIRLGIHDNEKIAKILGYSVNTIYAYKTKVKGKSLVPNEDFERKIKEIKSV